MAFHDGAGGFSKANQMFDAFLADKGNITRVYEDGRRVLKFGDDVSINVRPFSSGPNSTPTLEIQTDVYTYKFRFK